jgi:ankyrin repeat protein
LWNYILQDESSAENLALLKASGLALDDTESLLKRNFSALHKIVLGLSQVDLDEYLKLSSSDLNSRCSLGRTPLCWAAARQNTGTVAALLKFGASPLTKDRRGQSPLHLAAEVGKSESLDLLLGAIKEKTAKRRSAEYLTSPSDSPEPGNLLEMCLNEKDYKGRSPLHFAARMNHAAHASVLIRWGADIECPDGALARTPLLLSIYWNAHEMISLLLQSGARCDAADLRNWTMLHYAARFGDLCTLRLLAEGNLITVDAETQDEDGHTAWDVFAKFRRACVIEDEATERLSSDVFKALCYPLQQVLVEEVDDSELETFWDASSTFAASVSNLQPSYCCQTTCSKA